MFFLISQPLIYLIQVPFSWQGWHLFSYYKYWFIWTILCLPMGFIGYFINKKNIISMIVLLPALFLLAFEGLGYFSAVVSNFPHHLLSFLACFLIIIFVVLNLFDRTKLKVITLLIVTIFSIIYVALNGGIINAEYETFKTLDNYGIDFAGEVHVTYFSGTAQGNVELVNSTDEIHSVKISGRKNGKYEFAVTDENEKEYSFEYHYDKDTKNVILNKK